MGGHFKALSAIFPIILKADGEKTGILLHRRQNTGYQDGKWDISGSGHVDEGETAQAAMIRECKEELGIDVKVEDLAFVHLSHRLAPDRTYYDIYFLVNKFVGEPTIMEPDKCSDLQWFDIDNLPSDMIDCRAAAVQYYKDKISYSEIIER